MIKCYKCKYEKDDSMFHARLRNKNGKEPICKICKSAQDKEYRESKRITCPLVYTEEQRAISRRLCKKRYKDKHKEKIKIKSKEYDLLNKDKRNLRVRIKRSTDSMFKLRCVLRHRISEAFKKSRWHKNKGSRLLLGAEYEVVRSHIECQFDERMSWGNHGTQTWHIDHIIPLSSAKTEEELIALCHYTNLRPLWWIDNLKKGAKLNYHI